MSEGYSRHRGDFSAGDSALGYLYQCRLALLCAIRRAASGDDFLLYLETLDDVVFEHQGAPPELLQTKHHKQKAANLTDGSQDLWKTLRVWCEGTANGNISPHASLYLITTSTAPAGSAASYLRAEDRNLEKAAERLRSTAQSSTSQVNQPAYAAFTTLGQGQIGLLNRVSIIDAAATIVDLEVELKNEVRWAVAREHVEAFLRRLEGWWLRRAIQQLAGGSYEPVLGQEFECQMDDLREQFRRDALPIDEDILAAEVDESVYEDSVFVRQLHLIDVGVKRVLAAVREYFRAFEQRSRWVREDLLLVGELKKYERRLVEEWDLVFARITDDMGPLVAEDLKKKAAREIYKWVEEKVNPNPAECDGAVRHKGILPPPLGSSASGMAPGVQGAIATSP